MKITFVHIQLMVLSRFDSTFNPWIFFFFELSALALKVYSCALEISVGSVNDDHHYDEGNDENREDYLDDEHDDDLDQQNGIMITIMMIVRLVLMLHWTVDRLMPR